MTASGFTPRQRSTVLLMVIAVIVVFAMLAGLVITSMQDWESVPPVTPQSFVSRPSTPLPVPTLLPSPSPVPEEGIWSQVQAARLFDQVAHQVEILRGLSPQASVPLSFLDEREMATTLRQFYAARNSEVQWLPYIALGLLPNASISIAPHPVAGFYIADQEQFYVTAVQQESSADDQALLAHAYTHALQDQHFDLGGMDARATTTDAALAVRALVEGDAMLVMALYRYEDLVAADWGHLAELIVQAEQPSFGEELDHSEAWMRLQHFPYQEGRRFADILLQAGGWEAVNQAYTAPPRSTEQVLHPERYLNAQDSPTYVVVPDLGATLGEGWTMALQDTVGEFTVGLYLEAWLPEETAWQAANGWDGDTLVAWEHTDGSHVLVWRTIWDSTAEATEFERALVALVPQRDLPARPVVPPRGLAGTWWETNAGAAYVSRVARYVAAIYAPDINALANIVEVLP